MQWFQVRHAVDAHFKAAVTVRMDSPDTQSTAAVVTTQQPCPDHQIDLLTGHATWGNQMSREIAAVYGSHYAPGSLWPAALVEQADSGCEA